VYCVCVFITAVPNAKLCAGGRNSGGHVLITAVPNTKDCHPCREITIFLPRKRILLFLFQKLHILEYSYTLHGSRQTLTQEAKDRGKAVLLTPHIRPRRGRRALLRPRQMMRAELRYAGPETTGQGLPAVFALEPAQSVVDVGREGVALLYPAACSFSAAPPLRGRVSHLPSPLLALHQSSTSCAALNVRDRLPKNNRTFGLGCEIGRDLSPGTRLFEPRPND
jgi:hypothetical protein